MDKDTKQEIIDLYRSGHYYIKEIAAKVYYSNYAVSKVIKEYEKKKKDKWLRNWENKK